MTEEVEIQDMPEVETGEPSTPPDGREKLYKSLNDKGLYTKSYDDFKKQFSDSTSIDKLYSKLNGGGLYTKKRADFYGQFFSEVTKTPTIIKTPPAKTEPVIKGPAFNPPTAQMIGIPSPNTHAQPEQRDITFFDEIQQYYNAPSSAAMILQTKKAIDLEKKTKEAHDKVLEAVKGNPEVKSKMIRDRLQKDFLEQQRQHAEGADIPVPQIRVTPVSEEEITDETLNAFTDENKARNLIKEIGKAKPEEKPHLDKSVYLIDATRSLENDDRANARTPKVLKNAKDIETGILVYDVRNGNLLKPEGLIASTVSGWKQKTSLFDFYNFAGSASKEDVIKRLEDDRINHDPDEPIPVPKDLLSKATNMIGSMPVLPMIAGGVTSLVGAPEASPFVASAVGGADMYKLGWAIEFQRSYHEFRKQGKNESEAYDNAKSLADKTAIADAAMGAAMGFIGGRAAGPRITLTPGFKGAATTLLKKAGTTLQNATIEGLAGGGIASVGQVGKNLLAREAGLKRDVDEGVGEQMANNLLLTVGIAAAAKLGRGMSPRNYRTILNGLFKAGKENIEPLIQEQVATGHLTETQAENVKSEIDNYGEVDSKIPANVAEEARLEIQGKLKKREELEGQLQTLGKPFHEEIKAKIEKLDTEINELAKQKEDTRPTKEDNAINNVIQDAIDNERIPDVLEAVAKSDPKGFLKMIADQVHGKGEEGTGFEMDAEQATREQFGDDLVDKAKELFPITKTEEDALPVGKSETPNVGEASGDSSPVGEGIPQPEESTGTQNGQEEDIPTGKEGEVTPQTVDDVYGLPFIEEPGDKRTGIKNAVSYKERFERTLPQVEVPKLGSDSEILQQGKELVDSGKINPLHVVDRINETNEGMHPDEAKAMQYYMHQLGAHEQNLREQLAGADTEVQKAAINGQLQQLSDEMDAATSANIKSGKAWSDVGNIRQIVVDPGFNPSRERAIIKDAYGGKIPEAVQKKLDKVIAERDEAIQAKLKIEEQLKNRAAEKVVKKIKEKVGKEEKKTGKAKKEDLKKERESLLEELKAAIKKDTSSGYAFPFPVHTIETIGKLAVNYFKEGYVNLEEIAGKVFDDIKAHFPGATKKDVRDAISQYDPLREEARDKDISKLESKETRAENKVESGDIIPKKTNPRLNFEKNNEWVKANQRAANAEYKLKTEKRKAFESQKNIYQKGLMWLARVVRLSILSGYNVLGKLASAATIGSAVKRIPEQTIGKLYSTIFSGIAKKAPIEGSPNLMAELKFYKEFFDPKKFGQNAWQILKSGSSNLTKQHGGAEYEHVPILYLPTDLHQIIKDPPKRATYEASFKNAMAWAEKNGLHINDPLVVQSMQTAAYKRAQYEIFQEQNWLSKKFSAFKTSMEKAGNIGATGKFIADFMIPVSTVPTNIAKRLVSTSPLGLVRGSVKVIKAFREGLENLSNEEADAIMRQLKQGSLGTALWLIGWFGYNSFGGLYSKFNPDKKREAGDLESDQMSIGGEMVPKPVQHALPLEIMQLAATMRRIHDNYKAEGSSQFDATYHAAMGSIGAVLEQIPVLETGVHAVEATGDPYMAEKLKEDVKRRFEPQILRETGIIPKEEKKKKSQSTMRRTAHSAKRHTRN